jgi:hypothetical protein
MHPLGLLAQEQLTLFPKTVEDFENTQRCRVYSQIVRNTIGDQTFEHLQYESISRYLLVNRAAPDIDNQEALIRQMFTRTYINLLEYSLESVGTSILNPSSILKPKTRKTRF